MTKAKSDRPLTIRQEIFVTELCKGKDTTEAATIAGYSPKTAAHIGYKLKQDPRIQKRIRDVKAKLVKKVGMDKDFVLNKWQGMIEVLGQEVQAMGMNGEPIFKKNGEPATKFIDPHALRNVLRDVSQYLGMLDKAKEEDSKLEKTVGVVKVSAPMTKEEWLNRDN